MFTKVARSNDHKTQAVFVVIVAALGALYKSANSPKASPGLYSFSHFAGVSFCFYF